MANPVLDADGNVDKGCFADVLKSSFCLKDEEMIDELNQILSGSDATTASDTASGN